MYIYIYIYIYVYCIYIYANRDPDLPPSSLRCSRFGGGRGGNPFLFVHTHAINQFIVLDGMKSHGDFNCNLQIESN